jgi:histidinol-phosphatase
MLVAEGAVDVAVEPELELYDMAALAVIVDEAGGRFSSLDGEAGPQGGNALATNGRLHDQVLAFVGMSRDDRREERTQGSVHDLGERRLRLTPPGRDDDPVDPAESSDPAESDQPE